MLNLTQVRRELLYSAGQPSGAQVRLQIVDHEEQIAVFVALRRDLLPADVRVFRQYVFVPPPAVLLQLVHIRLSWLYERPYAASQLLRSVRCHGSIFAYDVYSTTLLCMRFHRRTLLNTNCVRYMVSVCVVAPCCFCACVMWAALQCAAFSASKR